MKKKLLLALTLTLCSIVMAIAQDPALANPNVSSNPLIVASSEQASLNIIGSATPVPASTELLVNIFFARVTPDGPPTGAGAALFDWVFNASLNGYQGTQNADIPPFFGGDITFDITVTGNAGQTAGFSANLGNVSGLPENIPSNDVVSIFVPIIDDPLPVDLISFTGKKVPDGNLLEWKTASEENNEGFEIQKSADGRDWEIIGWIEGNGTTSEINVYEYLDRIPLIGENYYRLKQVDYDGQFEFSNIVILKYDAPDVVIEVTPNPSPRDVKVTVFNPGKEKMKITLYDSAGLLIWESGTLTNMETWKKEFSLVQKEMYLVTVQIGKKLITEKILIIDRA